MSLSALIRKRDFGGVATAIPAIFATHEGEKARTVARIATVAVANPENRKHEPPESSVPFWRWLLHYTDREPLEVSFSPPVTNAEALTWYPGAMAAEPVTNARQPACPMTAEEEATVLTWRTSIETDPDTIREVLESCQRDPDARGCFPGRANKWLTRPLVR